MQVLDLLAWRIRATCKYIYMHIYMLWWEVGTYIDGQLWRVSGCTLTASVLGGISKRMSGLVPSWATVRWSLTNLWKVLYDMVPTRALGQTLLRMSSPVLHSYVLLWAWCELTKMSTGWVWDSTAPTRMRQSISASWRWQKVLFLNAVTL